MSLNALGSYPTLQVPKEGPRNALRSSVLNVRAAQLVDGSLPAALGSKPLMLALENKQDCAGPVFAGIPRKFLKVLSSALPDVAHVILAFRRSASFRAI